MIRAKYPGAYDDMDDVSLENAILAKYPQYSDLPRTQSANANTPSLLQRAEKWYTTPTQTEIPGNVPGVEQSPEGITNSPQQTFHRGAAIESGIAAPALATGLVTATAPTLLGLGGGVLGGTAGSIGGRYLGEKVGAPELGADVGGLAGSLFGGYAGSRTPGVVKNMLIDATGKPTPFARLTLGSDRATALGELLDPEDAAYEQRAQDLMRRGREQAALDRASLRPGSPQKEGGYQPALVQVPIRPEPNSPLTVQQVPGPDSPARANLLTPAAKRGDPRAAAELQRRGRSVLFVPDASSSLTPEEFAELLRRLR